MELMAGAIGLGIVIIIIWWVLLIIGNWKLFEKAGKPGWHSIIPILNIYDEYDLCWNGFLGIVMLIASAASYTLSYQISDGTTTTTIMTFVPAVCAMVSLILQIIESNKLAKSFGKGIGWTLFLIFFDRIARIVLGFSDAPYLGKDPQ